MATQEEIDELRRKADLKSTDNVYGDDVVLGYLVDATSIDLVAANIWEQKAASLSNLVNTSESGSSRSMGDLYKNALQMAKFYTDKDLADNLLASGPVARSRPVVREGGF